MNRLRSGSARSASTARRDSRRKSPTFSGMSIVADAADACGRTRAPWRASEPALLGARLGAASARRRSPPAMPRTMSGISSGGSCRSASMTTPRRRARDRARRSSRSPCRSCARGRRRRRAGRRRCSSTQQRDRRVAAAVVDVDDLGVGARACRAPRRAAGGTRAAPPPRCTRARRPTGARCPARPRSSAWSAVRTSIADWRESRRRAPPASPRPGRAGNARRTPRAAPRAPPH